MCNFCEYISVWSNEFEMRSDTCSLTGLSLTKTNEQKQKDIVPQNR